ncbi:2TM domain-containing protein [Aquimarina agarilytica]|uniref:2TM domain-containing protein n=1 Tax=Aquimarina agarilytica TaxID=1087449 RepID=UPI00028923B4|nr:2TM domain-containing protein [Aquimarina agarilytica]
MESISNNNENTKYQSAVAHVEKVKEFYNNLVVYGVVITALAIFNFKTAPYHLWFFYPLFFWGLGLAIRGFKLFSPQLFFGKAWEERKIREFINK